MIINTTPHSLIVFGGEGNLAFSLPPAENPLRLQEVLTPAGTVEGIPLFNKSFTPGDTPLPPQKEGTFYYVSYIVASAFPQRTDLLFAGEFVRDEDGRIRGITSLARIK